MIGRFSGIRLPSGFRGLSESITRSNDLVRALRMPVVLGYEAGLRVLKR